MVLQHHRVLDPSNLPFYLGGTGVATGGSRHTSFVIGGASNASFSSSRASSTKPKQTTSVFDPKRLLDLKLEAVD
jgi:hypothetical protein